MSRKIQERSIVFPSGDLTLEGLYLKGVHGPGVVVGAPHPLYGGSMHAPACMEVAYGAALVGFPALRFNYRGVGASQGERRPISGGPVEARPLSSFSAEIGDYEAAVEELRLTAGQPSGAAATWGSGGEAPGNSAAIVAAGYSFGAAIALEIAKTSDRACAALLVSPPTKLFSFDALAEMRIPVLVIGGESDEYLDWPLLEKAAALSPRTRVERIPEADHFWQRSLGALGNVVRDFLQKLT